MSTPQRIRSNDTPTTPDRIAALMEAPPEKLRLIDDLFFGVGAPPASAGPFFFSTESLIRFSKQVTPQGAHIPQQKNQPNPGTRASCPHLQLQFSTLDVRSSTFKVRRSTHRPSGFTIDNPAFPIHDYHHEPHSNPSRYLQRQARDSGDTHRGANRSRPLECWRQF